MKITPIKSIYIYIYIYKIMFKIAFCPKDSKYLEGHTPNQIMLPYASIAAFTTFEFKSMRFGFRI